MKMKGNYRIYSNFTKGQLRDSRNGDMGLSIGMELRRWENTVWNKGISTVFVL